jgi:hypothetical protein
MEHNTVKIALRITIELDADDWADEYGVDKRDVRDDVRSYVRTALQSMPTVETVEVR